MNAHHRYVLVETAISVTINAVLSFAFGWLIFHGQATIDLARSAVVLDMLPQSIMVAGMASLVPTLLTRKRRARGTIGALAGAPALPRNALVRAFLFALAGAVVGIVVILILRPLSPVGGAQFLVGKVLYGAALAATVTPIAVRAALRDDRP